MERAGICAALLVALGGVVTASGEARSQALPGWKIADICAKESAPGQCAAFEGRAQKAVSASWSFVLDPVKQACLGQAKLPADQSWRLLAECLDGEVLKALDRGAVHTARTPSEPVPPPRPLAPPPLASELTNPPPAAEPAEVPKPQ